MYWFHSKEQRSFERQIRGSISTFQLEGIWPDNPQTRSHPTGECKSQYIKAGGGNTLTNCHREKCPNRKRPGSYWGPGITLYIQGETSLTHIPWMRFISNLIICRELGLREASSPPTGLSVSEGAIHSPSYYPLYPLYLPKILLSAGRVINLSLTQLNEWWHGYCLHQGVHALGGGGVERWGSNRQGGAGAGYKADSQSLQISYCGSSKQQAKVRDYSMN